MKKIHKYRTHFIPQDSHKTKIKINVSIEHPAQIILFVQFIVLNIKVIFFLNCLIVKYIITAKCNVQQSKCCAF